MPVLTWMSLRLRRRNALILSAGGSHRRSHCMADLVTPADAQAPMDYEH